MLKVENTLNSSIINAFLGNNLIRCAVLSQVFELVSLQKRKKKGFFLLTVLVMSFCGSYSSVPYQSGTREELLEEQKYTCHSQKAKTEKAERIRVPSYIPKCAPIAWRHPTGLNLPLIFTTKTLGGNSWSRLKHQCLLFTIALHILLSLEYKYLNSKIYICVCVSKPAISWVQHNLELIIFWFLADCYIFSKHHDSTENVNPGETLISECLSLK